MKLCGGKGKLLEKLNLRCNDAKEVWNDHPFSGQYPSDGNTVHANVLNAFCNKFDGHFCLYEYSTHRNMEHLYI